jgi:hypothetical protein
LAFTTQPAPAGGGTLFDLGFQVPSSVARQFTPIAVAGPASDGGFSFSYASGSVLVPIDGDVDIDGTVSLHDVAILQGSFGTTSGATWQRGDLDGDGDVDRGDFAILARNFGRRAIGPPAASAVAVARSGDFSTTGAVAAARSGDLSSTRDLAAAAPVETTSVVRRPVLRAARGHRPARLSPPAADSAIASHARLFDGEHPL